MINKEGQYPALSYWEQNTFFDGIDVLIVGSGIVGLNAAITLKEKEPRLKVVILERGTLPTGASTRNAGFACFGSMTELLDDRNENGEAAMLQLVAKRWKGLMRLRERVGDEGLDYQEYGGYELFKPSEEKRLEYCLDEIAHLNQQLQEITGQKAIFTIQNKQLSTFGFDKVKALLHNSAEGQIDTGKMMRALLQLAHEKGVLIYNGCEVEEIKEEGSRAVALCKNGWRIAAAKIIICNNGFAQNLLPDLNVQPARNQVLITKAIPNLKIKGCFHYHSGYFYFRNVGNRILLGGGRHLAKEEETTTVFQQTEKIQTALLDLLNNIILPNQNIAIEQWWSGILGIGISKEPIVRSISPSIYAAVRLGGMGVAIGSLIGEEAAQLVLEN